MLGKHKDCQIIYGDCSAILGRDGGGGLQIIFEQFFILGINIQGVLEYLKKSNE